MMYITHSVDAKKVNFRSRPYRLRNEVMSHSDQILANSKSINLVLVAEHGFSKEERRTFHFAASLKFRFNFPSVLSNPV